MEASDRTARAAAAAAAAPPPRRDSGGPAFAALTPQERVEAFFDSLRAARGYDASVLEGLRVERAERGRVVCRLRARPDHGNQYGTLHGGCIATLVDVLGSAVVVTASEVCGVALAITTNYLSPGPGAGEVEAEAVLVKAGRQIATAEVAVRTPGGADFARGTHIKALVPASSLAPLWASTATALGRLPAPPAAAPLLRSRL